MKQEEVDVSLDRDVLTIRGEKRCARKDERARVSERFYGTFQRSIQLPFAPEADKVQAQFDNGVLTITLPKQEQAQKTQKIQVRAMGGGSQAKPAAGGTQGSQGEMSQGAQGAGNPPLGAVR